MCELFYILTDNIWLTELLEYAGEKERDVIYQQMRNIDLKLLWKCNHKTVKSFPANTHYQDCRRLFVLFRSLDSFLPPTFNGNKRKFLEPRQSLQ